MYDSSYIYAVRYGQTYFNRYNKLQGWSNPPLTEQGLREADEVGKLLEDIDFQGAYSSDTERAQVTAQHIVRMNKASDGVHPKTVMNFREQFYGYFEGQDMARRFGEGKYNLNERPENGAVIEFDFDSSQPFDSAIRIVSYRP